MKIFSPFDLRILHGTLLVLALSAPAAFAQTTQVPTTIPSIKHTNIVHHNDHKCDETSDTQTTPADSGLFNANKNADTMQMGTGTDIDADFMRAMITHHQTGIDMAKIELDKGKDLQTQNMARSIIAVQTREISTMKTWLKNNGKSGGTIPKIK